MSELAAKIEAALFVSPSPLSEKILMEILEVSEAELRGALNELDWILQHGHGIKLKFIANGWVLETEPEFYDVLEKLQNVGLRKRVQLRRAAVEVLAIIAYNQPVTRSEIEELRGTRCEGILSRLLSFGLIKISGRKKVNNGKVGKTEKNANAGKDGKTEKPAHGGALAYKTTDRFLELFGLENIHSLPSLDEFKEINDVFNENENEIKIENEFKNEAELEDEMEFNKNEA